MRKLFPKPGGFCCQCQAHRNDDGSPVTWKCIACKGFVCRKCTLLKQGGREYMDETYCSETCRQAYKVQSAMLNVPIDDED